MKRLLVFACALAWSSKAFVTDHGPVFSYATPVTRRAKLAMTPAFTVETASTAHSSLRVRASANCSRARSAKQMIRPLVAR